MRPDPSVQRFNPKEHSMTRKSTKVKDVLRMTRQEADSIGVELPVVGELTEDDVVEALTGEVTPESREDVDEAVADRMEEAEQP
jgi:hypothetical protein